MLSMENKKYVQLHDPRVTADRYPLEFSDSDIDKISESTGGKCAIAIYKRKHNDVLPQVFSHISCKEVDVISEELPKTVAKLVNEVQKLRTIGIQEMCNQLMEKLMEIKGIASIPELTIGQSANKLWFEYRYGRVIASKMHRVMAQVGDDLKLKNKNENKFLSPAENLIADVL